MLKKKSWHISYLGVSVNGSTPKSSILIGFSIINTIHFGVPLFLETPICFLLGFDNKLFVVIGHFEMPWSIMSFHLANSAELTLGIMKTPSHPEISFVNQPLDHWFSEGHSISFQGWENRAVFTYGKIFHHFSVASHESENLFFSKGLKNCRKEIILKNTPVFSRRAFKKTGIFFGWPPVSTPSHHPGGQKMRLEMLEMPESGNAVISDLNPRICAEKPTTSCVWSLLHFLNSL